MIFPGISGSVNHPENGMPIADMEACSRVADKLNEVIIFRSTGPWSMRWIKRNYPTKNFHVKGKSSDWGPQAGFVPYKGEYSKVGHDTEKAAKGTKANDKGMREKFAGKTHLTLSLDELQIQLTKPAGKPSRNAIYYMNRIPDSEDYLLFGTRSGDRQPFAFRAVKSGPAYKIYVYSRKAGMIPKKLMFENPDPLEVMTSSEVGAGNKPMTGDYDLMAVCPTWGDYGSTTHKPTSKPGLVFSGMGQQSGLTFEAGSRLDKVLDMRTNTGARPKGGDTSSTFQKKTPGSWDNEHRDMGNLTPRILRCINQLNAAMGASGSKAPFRKVHHNAESHRNHIFGAITESELLKGEGFPLTVFQPKQLLTESSPTRTYMRVSTLETYAEFKEYAVQLNKSGYFVPRNWTWGMSIRDR
ncbi:MAG: hypothetical protein ACI9ES_002146 [Oceanospirillaceae bacterium]|jgi:hypothetical protein